VKIRRIAHKGLRRLFLKDDPKGLPVIAVDKLRKMLAFLQDMDATDELSALPVWRAHRLTGDRRGAWSLHVSRNWRLTFRVDGKEIVDLDFEDYH
jgi:proteic killer suppression protein